MNRSTRRRLPLLALLLCTPLFVSTSTKVEAGDAGDPAGVAEAGVCESAPDPTAALQARVARARAGAPAAYAGRDVIVLNGQGYNYAAGPARDLEQRQREQARPPEPAER